MRKDDVAHARGVQTGPLLPLRARKLSRARQQAVNGSVPDVGKRDTHVDGDSGRFATALSRSRLCFVFFAIVLSAATATTAFAKVSGTVINGTTGEPAASVMVTLLELGQEMDHVDEQFTTANGTFSFDKDLEGERPGMLRVEHGGASYSQMIPPGRPTSGLQVTVYDVVERPLAPTNHIMLLEPSESEILVNETYIFENDTKPPRTFRDAGRGVRFSLPPEAGGVVRVTARGPARMPLRRTPEETSEPGVYKVDFPVKPGMNQIDLVYLIPRKPDQLFRTRMIYPGLGTKLAVPQGVSISGEGVTQFDQHPGMAAIIYEVPPGDEILLEVSGVGRLPQEEPSLPASEGPRPEIKPAPMAGELIWILVLTGTILAFAFVYFYHYNKDETGQPAGAPSPLAAASSKVARRRPARRRK